MGCGVSVDVYVSSNDNTNSTGVGGCFLGCCACGKLRHHTIPLIKPPGENKKMLVQSPFMFHDIDEHARLKLGANGPNYDRNARRVTWSERARIISERRRNLSAKIFLEPKCDEVSLPKGESHARNSDQRKQPMVKKTVKKFRRKVIVKPINKLETTYAAVRSPSKLKVVSAKRTVIIGYNRFRKVKAPVRPRDDDDEKDRASNDLEFQQLLKERLF